MAKKIESYIKLHIPAGQANPSPPVGPALGQAGLNIMEFCKAFNASTQGMEQGMPIPVKITVFSDKSFAHDRAFLRKISKSLVAQLHDLMIFCIFDICRGSASFIGAQYT